MIVLPSGHGQSSVLSDLWLDLDNVHIKPSIMQSQEANFKIY